MREQRCDLHTTSDLNAVRAEAISIYSELFPAASPRFIESAFEWTGKAFAGKYREFQPIDAKYHDLEHTLQGTLAFVRLLRGYHFATIQPPLTPRAFELGLLAILLHDTGYLKQKNDNEGTGAKYTLTHVLRSIEFARGLLSEKGFSAEEISAVQNMIRCTGVNADLMDIRFNNELERKIGFALGTADLLGQMAAPDYVEKLDTLYQEFEEANRYSGKPGAGAFSNASELRAKTPDFWENYVFPKIENEFGGLYRLLADSKGRNTYVESIQSNILRIKEELKHK